MKAPKPLIGLHKRIGRPLGDERGALMVIAIVFVMVFMIIGVALYFLVASQTRATETERMEVKSFNVAEAGIDAGMLSLRLDWPRHSTEAATVQEDLIVNALRSINSGLYLPTENGVETPSEFLQVTLYDNVDSDTGATTTVADSSAPAWDSNGDGKMFVDSTANVGDDRHRILALAEKQTWQFAFPASLALWAGNVDSNGQGLEIMIEDGPYKIFYDVHDTEHKGVDPQPPDRVEQLPAPSDFSEVCSSQQVMDLQKAAQNNGTYFTGPTASADASAYLDSDKAPGSIIYIKSDTGVILEGTDQVGTEDDPVLVLFDTPDGTVNVFDIRGTGDFWGIVVTVGNSTLRGTAAVHGAMYCSGTLNNQGNGACGELRFNQKCISNINRQFVISVNLVPNTWEEYTLPIG
jgi:Tfp pilus assembly protein PilX